MITGSGLIGAGGVACWGGCAARLVAVSPTVVPSCLGRVVAPAVETAHPAAEKYLKKEKLELTF